MRRLQNKNQSQAINRTINLNSITKITNNQIKIAFKKHSFVFIRGLHQKYKARHEGRRHKENYKKQEQIMITEIKQQKQ